MNKDQTFYWFVAKMMMAWVFAVISFFSFRWLFGDIITLELIVLLWLGLAIIINQMDSELMRIDRENKK